MGTYPLPQDAQGSFHPSQGMDDAAPRHLVHRVVSVSPHVVEVKPDACDAECEAARVPAHDMIEQLQQSIADANAAAERMEKAAAQSREDELQAPKMAAQLQERLQLSAQMLKAFQSQITRVEMGIAELKAQERKSQAAEARAQQRLTEVESRIETALQQFAQRLEELSQAHVQNIETQRGLLMASGERTAAGDDDNVELSITQYLERFSSSMQEMAVRIAQLAAMNQRAGAGTAADSTLSAPPNEKTQDHAEPLIQTVAPLRFQRWAGQA